MAFMQHFLDICRILMGLTQQYDIAGIDFRENDQRNFKKKLKVLQRYSKICGTPTIFHLFWRRIRYFDKISISFYTIFEILMVLQSFGFSDGILLIF